MWFRRCKTSNLLAKFLGFRMQLASRSESGREFLLLICASNIRKFILVLRSESLGSQTQQNFSTKQISKPPEEDMATNFVQIENDSEIKQRLERRACAYARLPGSTSPRIPIVRWNGRSRLTSGPVPQFCLEASPGSTKT